MLVHEGKLRHARELDAESNGMRRSVGHQFAVFVDPLMHKKHHVGPPVVVSERLVVRAGLWSVCEVGFTTFKTDLLEGNDMGGGGSYFLKEAAPPSPAEMRAATFRVSTEYSSPRTTQHAEGRPTVTTCPTNGKQPRCGTGRND